MIKFYNDQTSIRVEFESNKLYMQDGIYVLPMNALSLTIDESDIATFKRASNNDVLFSGLIEDTYFDDVQADKDTIEQLFADACTSATGGGGNPEKEVASISIVNDGELLELLNENDEVIASADTSVWLDGVEIDDQIDTTSTNPVENRVIASELNSKQDELTAGDNIELDENIISSNQVVVLTQEEYNQLVLDDEVDPVKIYIISDATPVDVSQFVTSGWVNTQLETKQDTLSAGTGITISGNVISASADLSDYYTKEEIDNAELATSAAINDLNYRKQDVLSAGTGINIDSANTISCTATITVDDHLDSGSTNPVQNLVIYAALGDINTALNAINGNPNS